MFEGSKDWGCCDCRYPASAKYTVVAAKIRQLVTRDIAVFFTGVQSGVDAEKLAHKIDAKIVDLLVKELG